MQGDALRGGAGAASLPPGALIPLTAFDGVQSVPLPPAGVAAAQSLVGGRMPGLIVPAPLLVIPDWPRAPALPLGAPGAAMIPVPERGTARCSRARQAPAKPANVRAQTGMRMALRKPRMSFPSCIARIRKLCHNMPSLKHRTGRAMISASCFGRPPGTFAKASIGGLKRTEIIATPIWAVHDGAMSKLGHDDTNKTGREIEFSRGVGAGHMDKMIKRPTKPAHAALFTIQLAIALALFSLDIFLGPGIGDGIGYSIVLVLCLRNPKRGYALAWAAFTTLLVIAGGFILPDSNALHLDLINRALEIGTIWAVWFLLRAIVPGRPDF